MLYKLVILYILKVIIYNNIIWNYQIMIKKSTKIIMMKKH